MTLFPLSFLALFLVIGLATAKGKVRVPSLFSDHMVLMKSEAAPIWGQADPGEQVTATLNGKTAQATAGADGKWKLVLDLADSPAGPFELAIAGKGDNRIVIPDVVVGQVWLASGQSNMERTLQGMAERDEIAQSANPLLRQFRVERKTADTPQDDCRGSWTVAGPETAGDFTAIGYFFAKKIQAELHQPIGLVNVSWGGTQIESWLSPEAIVQEPVLAAGAAEIARQADTYPAQRAAFVKELGDWLAANQRQDHPCPDPAAYAGASIPTADWTPVTLPGKIAGPGLPAAGAIWLRKEIEVPAGAEVQSINGALGQIAGFESVYWNGKKIAETTYPKLQGENMARNFGIPQADVHPGKAVIAIRIYAPTAPPVISAIPDRFIAGPIPLKGEWLAKAEYSFPDLPPGAAAAPRAPHVPPAMKASGIFNGVVHPVVPYGLAGILWYQGEANTGLAAQYRTSFPLLIDDLRQKWGAPQLPFYFCQLANFQAKTAVPGESAWAELRDAQSLALGVPNTGEAVLIDVGEAQDIHPRDKRTPGDRLARIALAKQYGQSNLVYSGPVYDSMAVEGSKIRVKFSHADGGLAAQPLPQTYGVRLVIHQTAPLVPNSPGSPLEGFAICGEDRRWVWANAVIDADSVVVSSDKVPHPVAVRYAWADNPTCNLANGAGLPASPFRTDDFPLLTQNGRYGLPAQQK